MTKLLNNKYIRRSILLAPVLLAGLTITAGHAHASQNNNNNNNRSNTTKQTSTLTPQNIGNSANLKSSNNVTNKLSTASNQHINNSNVGEYNSTDPFSANNNQHYTNATKPHLSLTRNLDAGNPWDDHNSQAYKDGAKALMYFQDRDDLTFVQACGMLGVVSAYNPSLHNYGLGGKHGNLYDLGVFRVDNKSYIKKYKDGIAADGWGDPNKESNLDAAPFYLSTKGMDNYYYLTDPKTSAQTFEKDFPMFKTTRKSEADAMDIYNAYKDNPIETGQINPQNGTLNGTAQPYFVNIPIHLVVKDGNSTKNIVPPFNLKVNPVTVPGYNALNKSLTAATLIQGTGIKVNDPNKPFDKENMASNSPYFGNIMNMIPDDYSNTYGYNVDTGTTTSKYYYVVKNGKATGKPFVMTITKTNPNNPDQPHMKYRQFNGQGNGPVPSNAPLTGTKGSSKGSNPNSGGDANSLNSPSNNSGGGSGSGGKGAAAAAGAGGAAAGAGAAGGAAAGGGSTAGGAGGGANGTAGGVVQGGNGNNNSTPAGPNNNVIIQPGTTTTANNNGSNNNIVPEVPVVNNNDHYHHGQNNTDAAYNTEANNDKAIIALIAGIAQNDQKNNGILSDLINEDGNRDLNRQLNGDVNASQLKTQFQDQSNSLASDIQEQASQQTTTNQLSSMEHSYEIQSMQMSMAQSQAIANLESSYRNRSNQTNTPSTTTTPQTANPANDVANQLTSLNNIPDYQPADNIQSITVSSANDSSSNSSSTSPANNQEGQNVLNQLDSELGGLGNQQPSQPTSQGSSSQTGQDIMDQLNNALAGIGNSQPTSSSNANNQSDLSILNGLDNDLIDITNQANMAPMSMSMQSSSAKPASASSSANNQTTANSLSTAESLAAKSPYSGNAYDEQNNGALIHPNQQRQSSIIHTPNFQYVIDNGTMPHFVKGNYQAYVKFFGRDPYQDSIAFASNGERNVPLDY